MKHYHAALAVVAVAGGLQLLPNWLIAGVMLLLVTGRYLSQLDRRPAILELAGIMAMLQFVVAAVLMYEFYNDHYRYHMYVPAETYFSLAIPATCLFLIGSTINLAVGAEEPSPPPPCLDFTKAGLTLVAVGTIATVVSRFAPGELGFFFYLLAQLRYVGAIYVYFSRNKYRWLIIAFAFSTLFITVSRYGMFHELLLWMSMATTYFFLQRKRSLAFKLGFIASMFVAVSLVQLVKSDLRAQLKKGSGASVTRLVYQNVTTKEDAFGRNWQESMVIRLNQGWIVSKVIDYVPKKIPYAYGDTLVDAAVAAAVPRVLNPNKARASGTANVNRFTGLSLSSGTSMGMGPLGEGYANFGYWGALFVMFLFGVLLNAIYRLMCKYSFHNAFFLFAMPVVFLQAIKMETEFLTIFNHLSKSLILIWGLYYFWIKQTNVFVDERLGTSDLTPYQPPNTG